VTAPEIAETLRLHRLWIDEAAGGVRADLVGADLAGAYLVGTNLVEANLARADLTGAYLTGADLTEADLTRTVLDPSLSPWAWTQIHGLGTRSVGDRALGLYRRSRVSQHVTPATIYEPGRLYVAPIFSRCPVTDCHPGLYVSGKGYEVGPDPVLAAGWVDELLPCGDDKARLPRLRIVADRQAWEALTTADLEPPKA